MLRKGLQDEKKLKIDKMLSSLIATVFMPKFWNLEDTSLLDNQLTDFDLTTNVLVQIEIKDLIQLLDKHGMDWAQKELFADFLVLFSKENRFNFIDKAIAMYRHIQTESKTFSFEINKKIALAEENLNRDKT